MKTILALTFAALTPASALAWWDPQPLITINPNLVQAAVYNSTPRTIFCRGYVYGLYQTGLPINNQLVAHVPPGVTAYVYVQAGPPFFFVDGYADIRCQ